MHFALWEPSFWITQFGSSDNCPSPLDFLLENVHSNESWKIAQRWIVPVRNFQNIKVKTLIKYPRINLPAASLPKCPTCLNMDTVGHIKIERGNVGESTDILSVRLPSDEVIALCRSPAKAQKPGPFALSGPIRDWLCRSPYITFT